MIHKRNNFLVLLFSLIPGAGEMYMGFMKQGITLMSAFWGIIFITASLRIDAVMYILPIVWCYSFFHVHNIKNLPDEEFYAIKDDFLLPKNSSFSNILDKKMNTIIAVVLIFVGVVIMWNNVLVDVLYKITDYFNLPYWIMDGVVYKIPQFVIAIILIVVGILLIKGKHRQLSEEEQKNKMTNGEENQ